MNQNSVLTLNFYVSQRNATEMLIRQLQYLNICSRLAENLLRDFEIKDPLNRMALKRMCSTYFYRVEIIKSKFLQHGCDANEKCFGRILVAIRQ